jgi:hypothetical protein
MFGRFRPSPALIVACVALVVALGGTAFGGTRTHASRSIDGGKIKNHSIAGKKLKNDTLTGTQIKESALGVVPNARHALAADAATSATTAQTASTASTANTATNATAVDGVSVAKVFYAPASPTAFGAAPTSIASLGGLTISAACPSGTITLFAGTAVDHAHLTDDLFNAGGSNLGQADGIRLSDFDAAHAEDLTDDSPWGEATFSYARPDGTIVNGQLTFESSNNATADIFDHKAACLVSGFLISNASS